MPRASNGVYTLPNTVNPVVTNTKVTSTWANTTLGDIESVLTSCLDRAGRGAMQANLQMGGFKVTGAANGTAGGDLATVGQMTDALALKLNASAVSPFGADLIDSADAAAARSTLNTDVYKKLPIAAAATSGEILPVSAGFTLNTGVAAESVLGYYNDTDSALTVTQGSGLTLRRNGSTFTGNCTIPPRGIIYVWCRSTTEYVVSGAY